MRRFLTGRSKRPPKKIEFLFHFRQAATNLMRLKHSLVLGETCHFCNRLPRIHVKHSIMCFRFFSCGLAFLFAVGLSPPLAHACKPCPEDPLLTSIQQASFVLEGTVQSVDSTEEKASSGRARIVVRVNRWLFPSTKNKALVSRGTLQNLEVSWGAPCLPQPSLPKEKTRNVFFIAQLTQTGPENLGVLTGYCSIPFLEVNSGRVQNSGGKPLSLKKLQRKIQAAKSGKS